MEGYDTTHSQPTHQATLTANEPRGSPLAFDPMAAILAFLGAQELVIILVLILLVFGGTQLPKLARSLGRAQQEFKSGLEEGAQESTPEPANDNTADDAADASNK